MLWKDVTSMEGSSEESSYRVVVAIDIGTSYSGYAFSFPHDISDVIMNSRWGAEVGTENDKVPTAVLTDRTGNFKAFGYDAIQRYKNNDKEHLLFRNFKMILYRSESCSDLTAMSEDGTHKEPLKNLFSMLLKYLYDQFNKQSTKHKGESYEPEAIKIVLTIPSVWARNGKEFMIEAAQQAGIIESNQSPRLVIASEPVAASYMCRRTFESNGKGIQGGDLYMVVDCGGGTVDIAMHKMLSQNKIKEMHKPVSVYYGGTTVDQSFEDVLIDLIGKKKIRQYKKHQSGDWLKLMVEFWSTKRSVGRTSNGKQCLKILTSFVNHCRKYAWFAWARPNFLNGWINGKGRGFSYDNGTLFVTDDAMRGIYKESIDNIVKEIRDLLKSHEIYNTKYIVMAGGYSESNLLFETIQHLFEVNGLQVLQVPHASGAVMRGAVLFGHFPGEIVTYSS